MTIPSLPKRAEPTQPGQPSTATDKAPDNGKGANAAAVSAMLTGMGVRELLDVRAAVDALLPARELKDIDLEQELVLQLMATQELQREVLGREDTPANQLAQVSNAVQSALQNLVKLQGDIYTSERLKRIEVALVDSINEHLTSEQAEAFLAAYRTSVESRK